MRFPYLGLFTIDPKYFPLENILVPCAQVCLESLKDDICVGFQIGILAAAHFPLSLTACSLAKEMGRSIYCSRHLPFLFSLLFSPTTSGFWKNLVQRKCCPAPLQCKQSCGMMCLWNSAWCVFQKTVRLVVNYLRTQKAVVRVSPEVPLQSILPVICAKCEVSPEHVVLLRDNVAGEELELSKSLNELGIKELYAWDNKRGEATLGL